MRIKACVFDLDGTLLETRRALARPVNMTLEHFGLPPQPVENFGYYAGDGTDNCLRRALADAARARVEREFSLDAAVARHAELYERLVAEKKRR